ncbi:MAG TPA: hypothetical protein PKO12_08095 [Holophaga sp.]|nr:hypothetical protein [Holophaga sp.]
MHIDDAILRHLRQSSVKDQTQLQGLLASEGLALTVPTLSRRLRKLGIRKVMGYYRAPEAAPRGSVQSLRTVAPCLLILRTQPGLAQALAVALDQGCLKHLGGSVSGYDTIFLAPTDAEHLDALEEEVRRFLGL